MCENNVSNKLDTYINTFPQISSYILKSSITFPSPFATNIQHPFLITLKPKYPTQFSRHFTSNVFYQSIHISIAYQNRPSDLLFLSCHVWISYNVISYSH